MSYVLIVVGWLGGAVNGAAVSTQEFTSAERCEAARLALVQDAKARGSRMRSGPSACKSEILDLGMAFGLVIDSEKPLCSDQPNENSVAAGAGPLRSVIFTCPLGHWPSGQ